MSVKDLIANWEEALTLALSQPDDIELHDDALFANVPDHRWILIRSNVHAGGDCTDCNYTTTHNCDW